MTTSGRCFRIDHLLGRNLIENLTVLRFSNLVFEPLWSRKYIRNIQVYQNFHIPYRQFVGFVLVGHENNVVFQVLLSEDITWQAGKYVMCLILNSIYLRICLSNRFVITYFYRYFEGYGVIRDVVHSHILQIIGLLAMEPPTSLHGEDIRNEKVYLNYLCHSGTNLTQSHLFSRSKS